MSLGSGFAIGDSVTEITDPAGTSKVVFPFRAYGGNAEFQFEITTVDGDNSFWVEIKIISIFLFL